MFARTRTLDGAVPGTPSALQQHCCAYTKATRGQVAHKRRVARANYRTPSTSHGGHYQGTPTRLPSMVATHPGAGCLPIGNTTGEPHEHPTADPTFAQGRATETAGTANISAPNEAARALKTLVLHGHSVGLELRPGRSFHNYPAPPRCRHNGVVHCCGGCGSRLPVPLKSHIHTGAQHPQTAGKVADDHQVRRTGGDR